MSAEQSGKYPAMTCWRHSRRSFYDAIYRVKPGLFRCPECKEVWGKEYKSGLVNAGLALMAVVWIAFLYLAISRGWNLSQ